MNKIKNLIKNKLILSIFIMLLLIFNTILTVGCSSKSNNLNKYVIHATGGFDEEIYLNSKDSMLHYIKKGYKLFEVDFIYTQDGKIVCSHEFEGFNTENNIPTYSEFMSNKVYGKYQTMDVEILCDIIKKYPKIKIIFDTKETDKIKIFQDLYNQFVEYGINVEKNLIVQVYSYSMYLSVKDYNVYEFWFTNYSMMYPQQLIINYFKNEKKVTTIVLSNNFYAKFLQEGIKLSKKIAVHGTSVQFSKKNTINYNVDYIFIHQ